MPPPQFKGVDLEAMPRGEEKELFKDFIEEYNTGGWWVGGVLGGSSTRAVAAALPDHCRRSRYPYPTTSHAAAPQVLRPRAVREAGSGQGGQEGRQGSGGVGEESTVGQCLHASRPKGSVGARRAHCLAPAAVVQTQERATFDDEAEKKREIAIERARQHQERLKQVRVCAR